MSFIVILQNLLYMENLLLIGKKLIISIIAQNASIQTVYYVQ